MKNVDLDQQMYRGVQLVSFLCFKSVSETNMFSVTVEWSTKYAVQIGPSRPLQKTFASIFEIGWIS